MLVFLPYEAFISLDAVARTLMRVHWTKSKLLEWKTSGDTERSARSDLKGFFQAMLVAPGIATVTLIWLILQRPQVLMVAGPLLGLWFVSPAIAWWLSRPIVPTPVNLTRTQHIFLRRMSRKTWRYFETFVTEDDNWLPPDNVQMNPGDVIASRTSPTNIGMALLADLAAYDFGYISAGCLLDRTLKTFGTISKMERYRGHLFNWYDTRTLTPLAPQYVSTVDSGNLAGQLFVLGSGLRELTESRILPRRICDGLADTLGVPLEGIEGQLHSQSHASGPAVDGNSMRWIERQIVELERCPYQLGALQDLLLRLIKDATAAAMEKSPVSHPELHWWISAFVRACTDHLQELQRLAAWCVIPPPPSGLWDVGSPGQLQRLAELRSQLATLDAVPALRDVAALTQTSVPLINAICAEFSAINVDATDTIVTQKVDWLQNLQQALTNSAKFAITRIRDLEQVADQSSEFAEMDFEFLHNKSRELDALDSTTVNLPSMVCAWTCSPLKHASPVSCSLPRDISARNTGLPLADC
ncbi:MAG: hypothetical protein WKF77_11975 [Planctomycetaceae bacterium]